MNPQPLRNRIHHSNDVSLAARIPILAKCLWLKPLLVLLCMMSPLSADQFGDFTYTNNTTHITITGYTGAGGAVVIPSSIVGLDVTGIGNQAFYFKTTVTGITIPASVASIGNFAFYGCSGLTSLSIPSSVTSIGTYAFSYCSALPAITVNGSNPSFSSLDGVVFNKLGTTLIQYPGGKTGAYVIPGTVTTIGDWAFTGTSGLTGITIPFGVVTIGNTAFQYCNGITSLVIPGSVTTIGSYAFGYLYNLTGVTIPASVSSIGNGAFSQCSSLSAIAVDASNTSYSSSGGVLFNKTLTSLIQYPNGRSGSYMIPGSVTSIAAEAFSGSFSLTSVSIPDSVISIGTNAFTGCFSLSAIDVAVANLNFKSEQGILFNKAQSTLIQYPGAKSGAYVIPSTVNLIQSAAFFNASGLTSITIPGSVASIGSQAFFGCYNLESATFTGNAPTLGSQVFVNLGAGVPGGFKVYFYSGATGFTTPTWQGHPSQMLTGAGGTLADAVDAPSLTFTTGGSASWGIQTSVTHDGVDAAASGDISNNQETWMETTVTGPGTISFWWSTATDFNDFLSFNVDGVPQSGPISGSTSWQQKTYVLGAGVHTLRWRYVKDFFGDMFSDTAWVDEVVWTPSGSSLAEIVVEESFSPLTSGISSVNYGSVVTTGTPASRGFTIRNTGSEDLTSVSVTITGTDADDFSIQFPPGTTIESNDFASFGVSFLPRGTGARTATLRIASNDADENPFLISLLGTGVTNSPPVANAGGSYSLGIGFDFVPSGALTSDPNSPNDFLSYAWDLDNDGQYDDAVGVQPVVPWSFFSAMPRPGPNSVQLRVTDQSGATSTASAQVSIVPLPLPHYEIFTGATDAFDLAFKSLEFIPNGSGGYSFSGAVTIAALPNDPSGHALLASITDADDATQSVSLASGAVIPFYEVNRSQFWVSSNGVINFTTSLIALSENAVTHVGNIQVAVFWDDLHAGTAGDIRFAQLVDRAVVTWVDVAQFGSAATRVTGQAELFFDGRIRLSYGEVGIQDGLVGISRGLTGNFIGETDFSQVTGPASAFVLWTNGGGLTGNNALPGAVPFGDGVPNLLKFAFGLNPSGPDVRQMVPGGTVGLPASYLHTSGGTVWRVEYLRRKNSGLTYTPKKSTTLGSGSFIPLTGTQVVSEIVGFPDWQRVIVDEPYNSSTTPKMFTTVEVMNP